MAYLLNHLLSESASAYPDKSAVIHKDQTITYAQLEEETNRLANFLLEMGVRRGDRVGIQMSRSVDAIIGITAILKAGAAYVPIDPVSPMNRFTYIINKCGIEILLTSAERLQNSKELSGAGMNLRAVVVLSGLGSGNVSSGVIPVVYWQEVRNGAKTEVTDIGAADTDLAYILFTSGSTGQPKGVMISHLNSLTFVNSAHLFFKMTENDRFSNNCPLHFDMSIFDIFVAFKAGATVVIVPENTAAFPSGLAALIEKYKISVWNSVPSVLSLLAAYTKLDAYDLSSLRLVLFAGEVLPLKHLRALKEVVRRADFYNVYGQTEANSSTCYRVDEIPSDGALLPIGRPLPNFDVFALNEEGERIDSSGEKGELYVRASTVAQGYWGDGERTDERFVRNPLIPYLNEKIYRTGDMVRLDENGDFVFLGRRDHMVKSRGYRIEIGEIETVMSDHPGVKTAVVVPVPDELIGNRLAVFVVLQDNEEMDKGDIVRFCAERLPKYMIPEIVEFRNSIPMTSSGKADRQELRSMVCRKFSC